MEFLPGVGELEIRVRGGARIMRGRFPYGKVATVGDRGRARKERIDPGAFDYQIDRFNSLQAEFSTLQDEASRDIISEQLERANVHVLRGHDFNMPLGDLKRGTARIVSNRDAVEFEIDLPDESDLPTYFSDAIKEVRTGRAGGISPGFRIPPRSVVPDAETLIPEPGNPNVDIRVNPRCGPLRAFHCLTARLWRHGR